MMVLFYRTAVLTYPILCSLGNVKRIYPGEANSGKTFSSPLAIQVFLYAVIRHSHFENSFIKASFILRLSFGYASTVPGWEKWVKRRGLI